METIHLNELPAVGAALAGGLFAGLTTTKEGAHCAVVLLPERGTELNWKDAKAWAKKLKGELPSRPVAALLFANVRGQLLPHWHWTNEEYEHDASFAWGCTFGSGYQFSSHKSYEGSSVAVRLIQLSA